MSGVDYQAEADKILVEDLPELVEMDESGWSIPANEYRAFRLQALSCEIRRCLWQPWAKQEMLSLARDCDNKASELMGRPMSPWPRYDAFVSQGRIYPAIH